MNTGQNKKNRDYKREHELRTRNKKRLVADIEKEKALKLEAMLKSDQTTFSNWINQKINEYLKEAQ